MKKIISVLKDVFTPNKNLNKKTIFGLIGFQVIIFCAFWATSSSELIPTPSEILSAGKRMIMEERIFPELYESVKLSMTSMIIATIVSLIISYLTVIPFFRPIGSIITKFRFLSLVGLTFLFTLMTADGYNLKADSS